MPFIWPSFPKIVKFLLWEAAGFDLEHHFFALALDLRYGGLQARLDTMHQRLIAYLDPNDTTVSKVEELDVELETVHSNSCFLMLDYSRAARATYI